MQFRVESNVPVDFRVWVGSAITGTLTSRKLQVEIQVTINDDEGVVRHVVAHPYHRILLRRCWMLVEAEAGGLDIIGKDNCDHHDQQRGPHEIKTYQFAQPTQDGIESQRHVQSGQWNERQDIERKYLSSTYQQQPEDDCHQREHQVFAIPPAIDQVKEWKHDAQYDEHRVTINPDFPARLETPADLAALCLSYQGVEHAQVRVSIPGQVPGIGEQFVFQHRHQHEG